LVLDGNLVTRSTWFVYLSPRFVEVLSADMSTLLETTPQPRTSPRPLRQIATLITVAICTLTFAATSLGIASLLAKNAAGAHDFIQYWAAGYQLIHHANPYDADAILPMERAAGYPQGEAAFIMPNPPTSLPLVAPLGFLGPRAAELLWLALSLACLVASMRMIWTMHDRPKNHLRWIGYSFAPVLLCLLTGQIAIFILFGLVLFLRIHRCWPFLAGLSLWFCLLKPHLFLPFGIALLAWVVVTRNYKILAGIASSIAVSNAIALWLDPSAWTHYGKLMTSRRPDLLSVPCLSVVLRQHIGHTHWMQYLLTALGCIWALARFRKHIGHWDWMEQGSLLTLISVLVAPYTWPTDQAILILALLHAAYSARSQNSIACLALASALIEIAILRGVPLDSPFFIWTSPAWLAWYLWARGNRYARKVTEYPALAGAPGEL
jgi:hypothetical protein